MHPGIRPVPVQQQRLEIFRRYPGQAQQRCGHKAEAQIPGLIQGGSGGKEAREVAVRVGEGGACWWPPPSSRRAFDEEEKTQTKGKLEDKRGDGGSGGGGGGEEHRPISSDFCMLACS